MVEPADGHRRHLTDPVGRDTAPRPPSGARSLFERAAGKLHALRAVAKAVWIPVNLAIVGLGTRRVEPVGISAYCIWRSANAAVVSSFIESLPKDAVVHLHCLDGVVDPAPDAALHAHTRSSGPGLRMPLLGALIASNPPRLDDHLLIFDDDVVFVGRGGRSFPAIARTARLDIAQPAHVPFSPSTFAFNQMRLLSIARATGFVEVGPVVLMSPTAWSMAVPFPADIGMGWGLDVEWTRLREAGLRLGVVDATPVRHLKPVAAGYQADAEWETLQTRLRQVGAASVNELADSDAASWRPWRSAPPWIDA